MRPRSGEELRLREAVIATARAMNAVGLNRGRSGNVSARFQQDGLSAFLITPTGMAYETLTVEDVVALHMDGALHDPDGRAPSSEWQLHGAIYRSRPDVHAIVHAHSMFATTLACMDRGIPAIHYMIAVAGGNDIRCAPYALFGTEELAQVSLKALQDRRACLLAHHGLVALGSGTENALEIAVQVETLAEIYWRALQIGEPEVLSDAQMSFVRDKFATYGRQK